MGETHSKDKGQKFLLGATEQNSSLNDGQNESAEFTRVALEFQLRIPLGQYRVSVGHRLRSKQNRNNQSSVWCWVRLGNMAAFQIPSENSIDAGRVLNSGQRNDAN
jgi:hypothetical protein